MSGAVMVSFEKDVRALITSRHGIAVALTRQQVKDLFRAVNLPNGEAFLQKLRDNGMLRALPLASCGTHPRYAVESVVRLCVELNGGERRAA